MIARLTEITGREARSVSGDALAALIDFYRAFNARDVDGLAANWEQGDAPSMDNPMGGIRRGWQSISEGYLKLFGGPAIVEVTFHDFTSQGGDDWHLFVGREKGTCTTSDMKMDVRFRTTRWFRRRQGKWRHFITTDRSKSPGCLRLTRRPFSEPPWARWLEAAKRLDACPLTSEAHEMGPCICLMSGYRTSASGAKRTFVSRVELTSEGLPWPAVQHICNT
jgi:hypothetical protein